jgi:sulfur carrier protein ThiS
MLVVKIEKYVGLKGSTVIVEKEGNVVDRYTTTNVEKMLKLIAEDYGKVDKVIDKRVDQ